MKIRQTIKVSYEEALSYDSATTAEVELSIDSDDLTVEELEDLFSQHLLSRFTRADLSAWRNFKQKHLLPKKEA